MLLPFGSLFRPSVTSFRRLMPDARAVRVSRRRRMRPSWSVQFESLEDRRMLSTVNWVNQGNATNDSDGFASVFCVNQTMTGATCTNADLARNVVSAALQAWEDVIISFHYQNGDLHDTYAMTVNMQAAGTSRGASALPTADDHGKPVSGMATIGRGNDLDGDSIGDGGGWYLDPTPTDHSEFMSGTATLINAFAAQTIGGSPAAGLADLYQVVLHEFGHAFGMTSLPNYLLQQSGLVTNTGQFDPISYQQATGNGCTTNDDSVTPILPKCVGRLWTFNGPSIKHLLTSFDSGAGTPTDAGFPAHSAPPGTRFTTAGGTTYLGADDLMNPIYTRGQRWLIPDTTALMLQDAYGYQIRLPQTMATYYALREPLPAALGPGNQLHVRGGTAAGSNDVITVWPSFILDHGGGNYEVTVGVTVDVGSDVPGTGYRAGNGNLPGFTTYYANIDRIVIESGSARDTIVLPIGIPGIDIYIDPGAGDDTVNIDDTRSLVRVYPSAGMDTVNITPNKQALDFIRDRVIVDGGSDADTLNINNSAGLTRTYTLTDKAITGAGGFLISHNGRFEQINFTGNILTTINVRSNAPNVNASVLNAGVINVGLGNTSNILGKLWISSFLYSKLNVNDSASTIPRNIRIAGYEIQGFTEAPIDIALAFLSSLTVTGGLGGLDGEGQLSGNHIVVADTRTTFETQSLIVNAGAGTSPDTVDVYRSQVPVTINGQKGADIVNLGENGNMQELTNTIYITNIGNWSTINLNNSNDTSGRSIAVSMNSARGI
ncbi:MAG: hypothetical protein KDA60_09550, partial [Planctomycetales bacterium]|nr:hypothetical protein [Planctomycetales bacterium]